jgi:membrane-bound metal-dependent hydrolase YbcI (DUF457 family)
VGQSSSFARLRRVPPRALAFAALGMAADLDLLIGRHSQFTHGIGMALAVGAVAFAVLRFRRDRRVLIAAAAAAAYGSHILLDWLGQDATPPLGISALWPFSSSFYLSPFGVFWGISREPWRPGAAWHDVLAIARELLFLGPLVLSAYWLRRPARWQNPRPVAAGDQQPLPPGRKLRADGESL